MIDGVKNDFFQKYFWSSWLESLRYSFFLNVSIHKTPCLPKNLYSCLRIVRNKEESRQTSKEVRQLLVQCFQYKKQIRTLLQLEKGSDFVDLVVKCTHKNGHDKMLGMNVKP